MRELPDDVLFDQRLIARHIAAGLISQEQVDERLEGLRDVAEHSEALDLTELQGASMTAANDTPAR